MALAWIMETIPSNAYVLPVSLVIAAESVSTKVNGLVKVCLFVWFFLVFVERIMFQIGCDLISPYFKMKSTLKLP